MASRPALSGTLLTALVLLLAVGCKTAQPNTPRPTAAATGGHGRIGSLQVTGGYIPAPASPDVAAAYFTVHNTGEAADTLIRVSSTLGGDAMLHRYIHRADGGEQMVPLSQLIVPGHGSVALTTGGKHLMLMNPRRQLRQGDHTTLTLVFAHAGTLRLTVPVVAATGLIPTSGDHRP